MVKTNNFKKLDSNILKFIAIAAMTIDHIAWTVFPGYSNDGLAIVFHVIGRITCPVMCYFIAEGFHYTKDVRKYTARLFLFAVISHFAYMFAASNFVDWKSFIPFYYGDILNQTSVIWSLAWGLVMLRVVNSEKIKQNWLKIFFILLICVVSFPSDWSCIASLCVLAIGTNRGKFNAQMLWMLFYMFIYAVVYFFALDKVYGIVHAGVILAIPFLMMYNGKRGNNAKTNKFMKWFFYVYYPLHLFVIGIINYF
ncbi:MAG: conjugal transfer protein TraX [Clostridia bacterium]|nr:conjugal transfer protein TraX [Clostridia bacterium]